MQTTTTESNAKTIKLPYGVFEEAARRLNKSRFAIYKGWDNEKPEVVDTVAQIVAEWNAKKQEAKNLKQAVLNQAAQQ